MAAGKSKSAKRKPTKPISKVKNGDVGARLVVALLRLFIVTACILFVHGILYWGRQSLRARARH